MNLPDPQVAFDLTGQTALITCTLTVVSVIKAAPSAIRLPRSKSARAPSAVGARNVHHTVAFAGITFG